VHKNHVYLTGNDRGLFQSIDPLGPFEFIGHFVDIQGERLESERDPGRSWEDGGAFDPALFVDVDGRIYLYYAGGSTDGKSFSTVVDKTENDLDNAIEFDEITPIKCRHVRLTITGWPKDHPCGVLEFTVFGRPTPP